MDFSKYKIAIVHDWLPLIGGAELVLKQLITVFPDADIYTLFDFLTPEQKAELGIQRLNVSRLNKLPGVKKYYRNLLPILPIAIERFDLFDYDLVISSSHLVAKGVLTGAHQKHISYVHSPARYAWDLTHVYLKQTGLNKGLKGVLTNALLNIFRIWDYRTANGVDIFIANSNFIKARIFKVYRRDSIVIHPPVNLERFTFQQDKKNYYLTASRMVPYKRMDLIVAAFKQLQDCELHVIGDGPEMENLKKIAAGQPNIKLLGYQANEVLVEEMKNAKAFIFAAEEDFGIVPLEAQACGTPVIAYGSGGALETVVCKPGNIGESTGLYFYKQETQSLVAAIKEFELLGHRIQPETCRLNAERFAVPRFRENIAKVAISCLQDTKLPAANLTSVV